MTKCMNKITEMHEVYRAGLVILGGYIKEIKMKMRNVISS